MRNSAGGHNLDHAEVWNCTTSVCQYQLVSLLQTSTWWLGKSRPTWISSEALVDGYGSNKLEVPNSDHQMGSLETTKITGDITMIAQPAIPIYPHLNFWWTQSWLFQATKKSSADIPIFRMWHITRQPWQRHHNHGPSDPQALSPRAVPLAMYIVPFRFPLFSLR